MASASCFSAGRRLIPGIAMFRIIASCALIVDRGRECTIPADSLGMGRMVSRYWRLDGFGGVDLLRADASTHRYARHSHEGYALGTVAAGAHGFAARGEAWTAIPGRVVIVNPDDAHDGGPAAKDGLYSYRMIYVEDAVLAGALAEVAGKPVAIPFFPRAVVDDAALAERLLS